MTTHPLLSALLPLVDDLSRELAEEERYRRLLAALRALIPSDATALLRLDGEQLIPLAVDGLSADTLGRRFVVAEHPRFQALLARREPTRFAADSGLPDPYDGLVEQHVGHLEVHDCLGCPLFIDDRPWGLLTLDALDPSRFGRIDLDNLETFARLAAATVKATERLSSLALRAENEHQLAETYRQAASQAQSRELIGQSPAHRRLLEEIELNGKPLALRKFPGVCLAPTPPELQGLVDQVERPPHAAFLKVDGQRLVHIDLIRGKPLPDVHGFRDRMLPKFKP